VTTAPPLSFDLDRTYPAPRERVWAAWTRADPRPDGDAYSETATVAAFEPVERLVLDVLTAGEDMSERSRCTVLLLPVEGGTRLELTVEGLSGAEAADGMRVGWLACLDGLAAQLSATTSPARPDRRGPDCRHG